MTIDHHTGNDKKHKTVIKIRVHHKFIAGKVDRFNNYIQQQKNQSGAMIMRITFVQWFSLFRAGRRGGVVMMEGNSCTSNCGNVGQQVSQSCEFSDG